MLQPFPLSYFCISLEIQHTSLDNEMWNSFNLQVINYIVITVNNPNNIDVKTDRLLIV